jgi:hypothetical protein
MEPKNWFQGTDSASLCSLAGRYDNPIPTQFLAPIDCSKIPARLWRLYISPVLNIIYTFSLSKSQSPSAGSRAGSPVSVLTSPIRSLCWAGRGYAGWEQNQIPRTAAFVTFSRNSNTFARAVYKFGLTIHCVYSPFGPKLNADLTSASVSYTSHILWSWSICPSGRFMTRMEFPAQFPNPHFLLCCHLSLLIRKQSSKYLNLTCTTIIFLVTNVLLCSEKYSFFVQEGAKIFLVFDS